MGMLFVVCFVFCFYWGEFRTRALDIKIIYTCCQALTNEFKVVNPITVYSYGFLFNCTTVVQASDSMTA